MSDVLDIASDNEEFHRSCLINEIRQKNKQTPFTGSCLYCLEVIKQGRFCDAECREGYEIEQRIKKISGKR